MPAEMPSRSASRDRVSGLIALIGSAAMWLLDKAIGDSVFALLRTSVGLPEPSALWRYAIEWGPAAALAGAGFFFFFRAGLSGGRTEDTTSERQHGSGGKGGSAKVGGNGIAIGGPGGRAGAFGVGGMGGGGEVVGDGYAAGGGGGHAGQVGIWPPPARSGYEVLQRARGLPIDPLLRQFGRGGVSPEYYNKLAVAADIKTALLGRECDPEDTDEVPLSAINAELERRGAEWRARIVDDQFEFFLLRV